MAKNDLNSQFCSLTHDELSSFLSKYRFPPGLGYMLQEPHHIATSVPEGKIALYCSSFECGNIRLPFTDFYCSAFNYFKVHVSQVNPYGNIRVGMFELCCRAHESVPTVTLFRRFYKLAKTGSWYTFEKRSEDEVGECVVGLPESIKGWKSRFFYVDASVFPANFYHARIIRKKSKGKMSDDLPYHGFSFALVDRKSDHPLHYRIVQEPILYLAGLSQSWDYHPAVPIIRVRGEVMGLSKFLKGGYNGGTFTPDPPTAVAVALRDFSKEIATTRRYGGAAKAVLEASVHAGEGEIVGSSAAPLLVTQRPFGTVAAPKKKGKLLLLLLAYTFSDRMEGTSSGAPKRSITQMLTGALSGPPIRGIRLVSGGKHLGISSGPWKGKGIMGSEKSNAKKTAETEVLKAKGKIASAEGGINVAGPSSNDELEKGEKGQDGEESDDDGGKDQESDNKEEGEDSQSDDFSGNYTDGSFNSEENPLPIVKGLFDPPFIRVKHMSTLEDSEDQRDYVRNIMVPYRKREAEKMSNGEFINYANASLVDIITSLSEYMRRFSLTDEDRCKLHLQNTKLKNKVEYLEGSEGRVLERKAHRVLHSDLDNKERQNLELQQELNKVQVEFQKEKTKLLERLDLVTSDRDAWKAKVKDAKKQTENFCIDLVTEKDNVTRLQGLVNGLRLKAAKYKEETKMEVSDRKLLIESLPLLFMKFLKSDEFSKEMSVVQTHAMDAGGHRAINDLKNQLPSVDPSTLAGYNPGAFEKLLFAVAKVEEIKFPYISKLASSSGLYSRIIAARSRGPPGGELSFYRLL
uniref:uncharacterized protein LOC122580617 n=1 Tax=Erigeron canadensis TaxID=72917 RepID=UPI001CB94ED3|nr:uncharacterized protein LOC122580617 [Erigeron canadensis]